MKLLGLIFNVCLLQKGPQDLPYSRSLFGAIVAIYIATGVLVMTWRYGPWLATLQSVTETCLILAFLSLALWYVGKLERLLQTACASLATDALISLIALPTLAPSSVASPQIAAMVLLLLMLWHIAVFGHILRHALAKPYVIGLACAVMYVYGSFQVMHWLFPTVD